MDREALAAGLRVGFGSATMVSIDAVTVPEMRKTGNPYWGRLLKRSHVNGVICWQYEAAVNRQRVREGKAPDFEALPRSWGRRIPGTPLVEHHGELYLEVKVQGSRAEYFLDDGTAVAAADVARYLPQRKAGRQDLDREVVLRDYRLDHITGFVWRGVNLPVI